MNICANSKAHQLRSILDIHIPLYSNYTSFLIIGKVPNKTKFKKKKKNTKPELHFRQNEPNTDTEHSIRWHQNTHSSQAHAKHY